MRILFETAFDAHGAPQQILTVDKNDPLHAADPPVASASAFARAEIQHADGRLETYLHDDPRVVLAVKSGPVMLTPTRSLSPFLSLSLSLSHSPILSLSLSLSHTHTLSLSLAFTHSLTFSP